MKKLIAIILILIGFSSFGQTYLVQPAKWRFTNSQRFDSTVRFYNLPLFTGDTIIGFNPLTGKLGRKILTSSIPVWGTITGTLSNQTDLQNALNAKQATLTLTTTGTSGAATLTGATLNIPQYSGTTYTAGNGIIVSGSTIYRDSLKTTGQYGNSWGNGMYLGSSNNRSMIFRTNNLRRVKIDSIGTFTMFDNNAYTSSTNSFIINQPNATAIGFNGGDLLKVRSDGSIHISDRYNDGVLSPTVGLQLNYFYKSVPLFIGRNFSNVPNQSGTYPAIVATNNNNGTFSFSGTMAAPIVTGAIVFNNTSSAGVASTSTYTTDNYTAAAASETHGAWFKSTTSGVATNGNTHKYFGGYFEASPSFATSATNSLAYGIWTKATGAERNYAAIFESGDVVIGSTSGYGKLAIPTITASANYASLSLSNTNTAFNGSTPGYFVGSLGTYIAVNSVGSVAYNYLQFSKNGASVHRIDSTGKTTYASTITTGGTTGDQTINKPSGTVNIAAAGTSVTVTNSLVSTSSIVVAVVRTNDTTAYIKNVVPSAGSFVITLGAAATAEVSIGFIVYN